MLHRATLSVIHKSSHTSYQFVVVAKQVVVESLGVRIPAVHLRKCTLRIMMVIIVRVTITAVLMVMMMVEIIHLRAFVHVEDQNRDHSDGDDGDGGIDDNDDGEDYKRS